MTTDLNVRDLSPMDVDRLRRVAAASPDWTYGQKIHTLIDAYETRCEQESKLEALERRILKVAEDLTDALDAPRHRGMVVNETPERRLERFEGVIKEQAAELEEIADDLT